MIASIETFLVQQGDVCLALCMYSLDLQPLEPLKNHEDQILICYSTWGGGPHHLHTFKEGTLNDYVQISWLIKKTGKCQ